MVFLSYLHTELAIHKRFHRVLKASAELHRMVQRGEYGVLCCLVLLGDLAQELSSLSLIKQFLRLSKVGVKSIHPTSQHKTNINVSFSPLPLYFAPDGHRGSIWECSPFGQYCIWRREQISTLSKPLLGVTFQRRTFLVQGKNFNSLGRNINRKFSSSNHHTSSLSQLNTKSKLLSFTDCISNSEIKVHI
jgi:hypothetical protein